MKGDFHTDEYTISLGREIVICKDMILRARKRLARFEAEFGMTTEEMARNHLPQDGETDQRLLDWHHDYQGLLAWCQRLGEYEAEYRRLK